MKRFIALTIILALMVAVMMPMVSAAEEVNESPHDYPGFVYHPEYNYEIVWDLSDSAQGWSRGPDLMTTTTATTNLATNTTTLVDFINPVEFSYDGALKFETSYTGTATNNRGPSIVKEFPGGLKMTELTRLKFDLIYRPDARTAGQFRFFLQGWGGVEGVDATYDREILYRMSPNAYNNRFANGRQLGIVQNTNIGVNNIKRDDGIDLGNGYYSIPMEIGFLNADNYWPDDFIRSMPYTLSSLRLSIQGTGGLNYSGDFYIDNIVLTDFYTTMTQTPRAVGAQFDSSIVNVDLDTIQVADKNATDRTKLLYAYLEAISTSGKVILGHQDTVTNKKSWPASYVVPGIGWHTPVSTGENESDIKDMVGVLPGLVGTDTLSLTGFQYPANAAKNPNWDDRVMGTAYSMVLAAKEGAILRLMAHMATFPDVVARPRIPGGVDGGWDWGATGHGRNDIERDQWAWYSGGNTSRDLVDRLTTEGSDLYEAFTDYLKMMARFCKMVNGEIPIYDPQGRELEPVPGGIPMIFRPYHEMNGTWFWWGYGSATNPSATRPSLAQYIHLWRFTKDFLEAEGVHNLLWEFSVQSPSTALNSNLVEYTNVYPGDDYVDMIGFSRYQTTTSWPTVANLNSFHDGTRNAIANLERFADQHGKLIALGEHGTYERIGHANNGPDPTAGGHREGLALMPGGTPDIYWFNKQFDILAESKATYGATWSNFGVDTAGKYYFPFKVSESRGHHMVDAFIEMYNDEQDRFIFADGTNFYQLGGFQSDAEFLRERAPSILRNGLSNAELRLVGKTLTLILGDREFVLSTNANNRNISGEIHLGYGHFLIFDLKGNGSNIKTFTVVTR